MNTFSILLEYDKSTFIGGMLGLIEAYGSTFIEGLIGTLWMSFITVALGLVFGFFVALMRMSKVKILNVISGAFIEVIRGTPTLLQLYFYWIGLPKLFPGLELSDTQCVVIGLIVVESAYISEIIRAGIAAVDKGQWEAARSLGMSERNLMIRIIIPQAVKNILPALGNEFITAVKGTSLASVFFVTELTTSYKMVQSATFRAIESLTIVGIIYFILNFVLSKLLGVFERRLMENDR